MKKIKVRTFVRRHLIHFGLSKEGKEDAKTIWNVSKLWDSSDRYCFILAVGRGDMKDISAESFFCWKVPNKGVHCHKNLWWLFATGPLFNRVIPLKGPESRRALAQPLCLDSLGIGTSQRNNSIERSPIKAHVICCTVTSGMLMLPFPCSYNCFVKYGLVLFSMGSYRFVSGRMELYGVVKPRMAG